MSFHIIVIMRSVALLIACSALYGPAAGWQVSGSGPQLATGPRLAYSIGRRHARLSGTDISMQQNAFDDARPMTSTLSRRALLSLTSLLLMAPQQVRADTEDKDQLFTRSDGKIRVNVNGEEKLVTSIEARALLDDKIKEMTAKGKGIDVERRGKNNEKAIWPDDFYKKFQIRPTAEEMLNNPQLPFANPKATLPYIDEQQRFQAYDKYEKQVKSGIEAYGTTLKAAINAESWSEVQTLLQFKSGKEVPKDSKLRRYPFQLGYISNKLLQEDSDGGVNSFNRIARYLINEFAFACDDIASAAKKSDTLAAKAAWETGASNLNALLKIINVALPKERDYKCEQFALVPATFQ
mmetsp:Transcript_144849/g.255309  ORF Transcript_144849/g.255309 Transcript_144849/m.255309 type:complete len:351 (+) Transcript_144849:34-1086(+)